MLAYGCAVRGHCEPTFGGDYTRSDCNGTCDAKAKHYACGNKIGQCVEDVNGTFNDESCGNLGS